MIAPCKIFVGCEWIVAAHIAMCVSSVDPHLKNAISYARSAVEFHIKFPAMPLSVSGHAVGIPFLSCSVVFASSIIDAVIVHMVLSRVDRFLHIPQVEVCFLRLPPGFPGGATIFQSSIRWPRPLTEPALRISRIRLFRQVHSLSADSRVGFGDNVFPGSVSRIVSPPRYT